MEAALTADEWISGKTSPPKVIDLKTKAITSYDGPKTTSQPASSTPPAAKEEPKPAPVKQTSITEKTGKLPDLRDLEIKQDDPDSDEEITEAKKRAPSTGGFDDDEDFVDVKPVEKAEEETASAVKAEEPVKSELKEQAAPVSKDEPASPAAPDQSRAKEVGLPLERSSDIPVDKPIAARRHQATVGRSDRSGGSS